MADHLKKSSMVENDRLFQSFGNDPHQDDRRAFDQLNRTQYVLKNSRLIAQLTTFDERNETPKSQLPYDNVTQWINLSAYGRFDSDIPRIKFFYQNNQELLEDANEAKKLGEDFHSFEQPPSVKKGRGRGRGRHRQLKVNDPGRITGPLIEAVGVIKSNSIKSANTTVEDFDLTLSSCSSEFKHPVKESGRFCDSGLGSEEPTHCPNRAETDVSDLSVATPDLESIADSLIQPKKTRNAHLLERSTERPPSGQSGKGRGKKKTKWAPLR